MAPSHEFHSDPSVRTIIKKKARQLCRRSEYSSSDFDDLCQELHLHLLQKAHLFDPGRACPAAFAHEAIKSFIGMQLRRARRQKRGGAKVPVSIERTYILVDGELMPLGETLGEHDLLRIRVGHRVDPIERIALRDSILAALNAMTPQQRRLFSAIGRHGLRGARRQGHLWTSGKVSFRRLHGEVDELRAILRKFGISGL